MIVDGTSVSTYATRHRERRTEKQNSPEESTCKSSQASVDEAEALLSRSRRSVFDSWIVDHRVALRWNYPKCIIDSWRLQSVFANLHFTDCWHVFTFETDRVDTGAFPMSDWLLKVCPPSEDPFLRTCGVMKQLYASKMLQRLTQGLSSSRGDSCVSKTTIRVVSVL